MVWDLQKSGISIDTATEYGIYPAADKKSYVIPYFEPETGNPMLNAIDEPYIRRKTQNKKNKYLSDKNSGIRCYIPKKTHEYYINKINIPLMITEGEKKAIAATEKGLYTIGIGGITMWRSKNGSNKIHPDLIKYLQGRKAVYLIYDSDGFDNPAFEKNSVVFAKELKEHGAKLYTIYLPQFSLKKVGLDDFLIEHELKEVIAYIQCRKIHIKPQFKTDTYGRVHYDSLDKYKLKADEYLLLTMISGLSKKTGYCNMTRDNMAIKLNVRRGAIINKIGKLRDQGLIEIKQINKRKSPIKLSKKGVEILKAGGVVKV